MSIILILIFISTPNTLACSDNFIDPDGKNIFFYEECLHMNRSKFTDELHQKCTEYSIEQRIKNNMNWEKNYSKATFLVKCLK